MLNHQSFLKACRKLKKQKAQLVSFVVTEDEQGEFRLLYHFDKEGEVVTVETYTVNRSAPSLVSFFTASDFPERQAFNDFSIKFFGNPNLRPWD